MEIYFKDCVFQFKIKKQNMNIISHQRNSIPQLLDTNPSYGVEVDIRSDGGKLIIHHDPFLKGESFEEWINFYKHGTLVLNVKEEGLEEPLIRLLQLKGIDNYFFLDQSFPFLIKWSRKGERKCAIRVSEFESIETALNLSGKVDWVWVDFFSRFSLTEKEAKCLKDARFKLCLVSPELQGHDASSEIPKLFFVLREKNIAPDAVCTKRPDLWEELILIP